MSEVQSCLSSIVLSLMIAALPKGEGWLGYLAPASLVRIEQHLTQGDENDYANDRRKEYSGEGSG
jgi:hypothetical protein